MTRCNVTERNATADRVAEALRRQIIAGELTPGQRLSEERVREEFGVSRSTLREAFGRLLRERLLLHELSRGVFVRWLTRADISDLYQVRRTVECAALRQVEQLSVDGLRRISATLDEGRTAADAGDWATVGAASIRFHEALVGLAGSPRLEEIMSGVLAEFRLAYAHMADTQVFHLAFLKRNGEIAEAVRAGDLTDAATMLDTYLRDAETMLLNEHFP